MAFRLRDKFVSDINDINISVKLNLSKEVFKNVEYLIKLAIILQERILILSSFIFRHSMKNVNKGVFIILLLISFDKIIVSK